MKKAKEITVYRIFYKIVKQETTIDPKFIVHLHNLLAMLLKIKLFEERKVSIACLGSFYLLKIKHKELIRFKMFKSLKRTIHGSKEFNFKKHYISYRTLNNLFINGAKCTGLKTKHIAFVFYIWIFSLIKALLQEKSCKVKGLGLLYIMKPNFQKECGIKKTIKYPLRVRFKAYKRTKLEVNKQREFFHYKRIKNLLTINKICI